MSGHEEENPKEPGGEVMEQVQDIETVGDLKRKGNKEDCLYKGEEVFTDCNPKGRC